MGYLFAPCLHLYSLATDPANIFSSRLHAVFFERISVSATDIIQFYSEHHRKDIYWTLLKQGHSGSAQPWAQPLLESTTVRRERTGNQNFPAKYAPSALLFNLQNGGRNSATSEEAQEDRKNWIQS